MICSVLKPPEAQRRAVYFISLKEAWLAGKNASLIFISNSNGKAENLGFQVVLEHAVEAAWISTIPLHFSLHRVSTNDLNQFAAT
jgi:hypothetical protein